ncbi:PAS domain S-box protein [candidate division KSB1 bacterium]|nr:PAS domain S-box protein [candidate division KSB1 bacterium]
MVRNFELNTSEKINMSVQDRNNKGFEARETKFRALAENSAMMIGILRNRKFVYINRYAEEVLGYSKEEILKKGFNQLINPKIRRKLIHSIEKDLRSGQRSVFYEIPVIAKSGATKWLYFSFAPYTYQGEEAIIGTAIDITDRKHAETERDHLCEMLAETPDIVCRSDTDGNLLYLNTSGRKLLGVANGGSLGGWKLLNFYPEWAAKIVTEQGIPTAFEKDSWRGEIAVVNQQREERPVSQIILAHRNEHGNVEYYSTIAHDISERKERERALKDSWEQYRTLVRTTPDAITMTNLQGIITFASPKAVKLYGYKTHQELLGRNALEFIEPPEHARALKNMQRTLREGEIKKTEYTMLQRDGTHFIGEVRVALVRDANGSPKGIIATTRDISERIIADRERSLLMSQLQNERAKLETIIECAPEGIVVCDEEARIIMANAVAEKLYYRPIPMRENFESHERLSICSNDGAPIPARELPLTRAALDGEKIMDYECSVLHPDGRLIYLLVNAVPIYDNDNNISGAIGIFQDITRHKELLHDLMKTHDMLEEKVAERTTELRNANKALKQEMRERRFYQNKLRALTSQLISSEERERRRIATGLHDDIVQELMIARNRLTEMIGKQESSANREDLEGINEFVANAIAKTRTLTFEISPPVLYELGLVPAIEWFAEEFQEKYDIKIIVKHTGEIYKIDEEIRNVMFQSVRELFSNVIKHSAAHLVKINIKEETDKISIEFMDNGKGFDSAEVFKSIDKLRGFGLFNVRERLDFLGGKFFLESKIGKGTKIILRAPLSVKS